MSNILPFTIRAGALPPSTKYTPQEFLEALSSSLQIESQQQFAVFEAGSVEPTSDKGPFLLDKRKWRVWNTLTGAYSPLVLEQESLRYIVQAATPDQTKYDVWIKLNGSGKAIGVYKYYDGSWQDAYVDALALKANVADVYTKSEVYNKTEVYAKSEVYNKTETYTKTETNGLLAGGIPAGMIMPYAGGAAPAGYLICNGQAVDRSGPSGYPALFAVIGTTYGIGNAVSTFNVPDLRGRTVVGVGTGDAPDATAWTLAQKRGEEDVALSEANLPGHTHSFSGSGSTDSQGVHSHTYYAALNGYGAGDAVPDVDGLLGKDSNKAGFTTTSSGAHSHSVTVSGTTGSTGSGTVHTNIQPSIALNYIIKT